MSNIPRLTSPFFETLAVSTLRLKSRKGLTFSMLLKHSIESLAWWKFTRTSFFAQLKFPSRFLHCILSKTETRHFNVCLICFRNSSDLHCIHWLCHQEAELTFHRDQRIYSFLEQKKTTLIFSLYWLQSTVYIQLFNFFL